MGLNAGKQFLQAERLGDIVVPSGPQAVDLILLCDPRRQEQDGTDDMINLTFSSYNEKDWRCSHGIQNFDCG